MKDWKPITNQTILQAPVLVQTTFEVDEPADTFLDMSAWHKGIVFVNGFNIGRYFRVGPQQTLYVPGPLLKVGVNTVCYGIFFKDYNFTLKCFHFKQNMPKKNVLQVTIFEQFEPSNQIVFQDTPNLGATGREEWKVCRIQKNKINCFEKN